MSEKIELSPEQVVAILNEHRWRGRSTWTVGCGPGEDGLGYVISHTGALFMLHMSDARAIASWLELTKPGSWHWALEQMKTGKRMTRAWPLNRFYLWGKRDAGSTIIWIYYLGNRTHSDEHWRPLLEDFEATDWQIVGDGIEGAR